MYIVKKLATTFMETDVSSAYCLLVKTSLCVEAAKRPHWPRLYYVSRPSGPGLVVICLVGDPGQL